ncbi:nucleoside hydrolase [Alloacidobacterium dinghuense]|uniref:Nucleoside hydrolase n=1 Tax=Alloacidobacterium dinghuense TaxID=2763107 RepID=A0A7G8BDN6_9BACT|nr:nucleoside hydrolase [Alloacidobacterium dinghuense]QNI30656.1 nucleoside hydrolase [Alloacidobacterium dinghuense]
MNPHRRPILIDTDTASDDAVALIMALRSSRVEVKAITTVAGNVRVEQATRNALFTVELCGAEVPVFSGAAKPLEGELQTADWFHGQDGLGDHGYAPSVHATASGDAVDAIVAAVQSTPGIEIITLGPLTNLALALERCPTIAHSISRCVVMGGAPCCEGNVTPAAEFNIWVDPEAARAVFASGAPIEMIGWQLARFDAVLNEREIQEVLAFETPLAEFAIRANSTAATAYLAQTGETGISLPDPVAMAVLLDPKLKLEVSPHYVAIECKSDLTRGMTVVDRLGVAADSRNSVVWSDVTQRDQKVEICWKLDVPGWKAELIAALRPENRQSFAT